MNRDLQRIPPRDDPPREHGDDCQCEDCLGLRCPMCDLIHDLGPCPVEEKPQ